MIVPRLFRVAFVTFALVTTTPPWAEMVSFPPQPGPWRYNLCDDYRPIVSRFAVACRVWQEGTWVTSPSGFGCEGGVAVPFPTEASLTTKAM